MMMALFGDPVDITDWQNVDSNGNTQHWFTAKSNQSRSINAVLESRYQVLIVLIVLIVKMDFG